MCTLLALTHIDIICVLLRWEDSTALSLALLNYAD